MKPTLDQAGKLLKLVSQSGRTDAWVQEHLIGSGAFSDILAVDNLRGMDREERRRFFGLPPLNPPFLEKIGTTTIAAITEKFVVRDRFVLNYGLQAKPGPRISYIGDNVSSWFLGKIEKPRPETILDYAKLTRPALDKEIRKEIGAEREETTLAEIYALMECQPNGEEGVLLTDGRANIFYVKDAVGIGILCAVSVRRGVSRGGWGVRAREVTNPGGWDGGYRVFSRNSSVPVAV